MQAPQESSFQIHLDFFDGPMDLLLHLVQQREVSLAEVDLSEICEQYLELVSDAHFLDLDRASEYLVIAATLLSMKSQSLLPVDKANGLNDIPEGADPAFYEALRERLRQYEVTKQRAEALLDRPQLGRTTFARPARALQLPQPEETSEVEVGDATTLGKMFVDLIKRIGGSIKSMRIALEPISIVGYMMKVIDELRLITRRSGADISSSGTFSELVRSMQTRAIERNGRKGEVKETGPSAERSRSESTRSAILGSFLALLELMKRGLVAAEQASPAEEIQLTMKFQAAPDLNTLLKDSPLDVPDEIEANGGELVAREHLAVAAEESIDDEEELSEVRA